MEYNIVPAIFRKTKTAKTDRIFQWDYGQILIIVGLELPDVFEVHFSNQNKVGLAKPQVAMDYQVEIPDEYLTTGQNIYAWIFLHTGEDDGETEYSITIPVTARPKPIDEEPTPVQQSALEQAIAALNAGVTDVHDAVDSVQNTVNVALQEAKDSGEFDGPQGPRGLTGDAGADGISPTATITQTSTGAIISITDAEGTTTATLENGQDGAPGTPGANGAPGQDGVSPTVSVTDITGGHRVSVTDASGTHTFDVMDGAAGRNGLDGSDGEDGLSPTATVTQTSTGATISITDKTGTTTAQITNGQDGAQGSPGSPGAPGVSPTVTVTDITGGHRVTITDATGAHTFDVMDGEGGGTAENGLPTGGTTGQVLKKTGSADYAAGWSGMALNDLSNVNINLPYQGCVLTFNNNKWGAGLAIMSQCGFIDEDIDYDTGDPTGTYAIFNGSCLDPMHTQYVRDDNGYVMTHNQHEVYWTSNFDDYTSDSSIYLIDRASGTPFNRNIMRFAYNPNTGTYAEAPLALTNEVTGMWTGTQAQYDALATKDAHTVYFIQE